MVTLTIIKINFKMYLLFGVRRAVRIWKSSHLFFSVFLVYGLWEHTFTNAFS